MTRIDRYILFLYFRVMFICFMSLTGLIIVVQVFTNLDELSRSAQREQQSLLWFLGKYFAPRALTVFEYLSGLYALLALLFVIAWLYRTNEFTALMAAGVNKWRVVRPMLIASACVILGAALLRETVIPRFQDQLSQNAQDLSGDARRVVKPTSDQRTFALISGDHLAPARMEISGPLIHLQNSPLSERFGLKIAGGIGNYMEGANGRPTGYMIRNVTKPPNLDAIDSYYDVDGSPLLLTRKDTDWIEPNACFLVSSVEYEALRGGAASKHYASTSELITQLRMGLLAESNDLRVLIHQRFLRPFIDWTLLLLAIPVLLTRSDRHVFMIAGTCLLLVIGFTGFVMGLAQVALSGNLMDPLNAVWLPLVIFLPIGWAQTVKAMNS